MYLRTTKRKNKDGTIVEYYHLAQNYRHPQTKRSIPKNIYNFGRADQLDREKLVRLCRFIARVCGLEVRDIFDDKTNQIFQEQGFGLPKDVKLIHTTELGTVMAINALWERLGIEEAIREVSKSKGYQVEYERALLAMTANRLCEPDSKLGVWDRWLTKVYLPSCQGIKLGGMYEAMDVLLRGGEEVERSVFFRTADLFNLEVDLIFYDTSTASFSIDWEDEDSEDSVEVLRKLALSKEGSWKPQVVVALAVTREGLPVRSWVFPGNTTDVNTVEKLKADLKGWKLGRALFVAEAGMNSTENRKELARSCGKYILAARMGSVTEIKQDVLPRGGRCKVISDNLQAKEIIVGDGERRRRYILSYNPNEAKRERLHREKALRELEKELGWHKDLKATSKWATELRASGRYKRYLTVDKNDNLRLNKAAIRKAQKYDGKWVLITNDDTISVEDAASGYKGLLAIERCFRSLKRTQIKMTPMNHWRAWRIEAHVKICFLALLIERAAELACGKPWARIRNILSKLQVSKFQTNSHQFFQRNETPSEVRQILKSLKIPVPKIILDIQPTPDGQ